MPVRMRRTATGSSSSITLPAPPSRMKRELTKHVVTRWYRAPELILLSEHYSTAIDMWSIGCILAELLSMQAESHTSPEDRQALFPGRSCFPLSADHPMAYADQLDQLNVIFDVIGTPSPDDLSQVDNDTARGYIGGLKRKAAVDLYARYASADVRAIDLLSKLLVFNPRKRYTANQCLAHPFFDAVRDEMVGVRWRERGVTDFNFEDKTLSKEQIRALIMEEILVDNPHLREQQPPPPPSMHGAAVNGGSGGRAAAYDGFSFGERTEVHGGYGGGRVGQAGAGGPQPPQTQRGRPAAPPVVPRGIYASAQGAGSSGMQQQKQQQQQQHQLAAPSPPPASGPSYRQPAYCSSPPRQAHAYDVSQARFSHSSGVSDASYSSTHPPSNTYAPPPSSSSSSYLPSLPDLEAEYSDASSSIRQLQQQLDAYAAQQEHVMAYVRHDNRMDDPHVGVSSRHSATNNGGALDRGRSASSNGLPLPHGVVRQGALGYDAVQRRVDHGGRVAVAEGVRGDGGYSAESASAALSSYAYGVDPADQRRAAQQRNGGGFGHVQGLQEAQPSQQQWSYDRR